MPGMETLADRPTEQQNPLLTRVIVELAEEPARIVTDTGLEVIS